jgi:hypothetical protein
MSAQILKRMESGSLSDILFIGTGALMNSLTMCQGGTIPGISHLVRFKAKEL